MKILIPKPVIKELEGLAKYDKKYGVKEDAKLALKLLEVSKFDKRGLDKGSVDSGIIQAAKADHELVVATLDRRIKSLTRNPKLVIRGKKKLVIE